LPGLPRVKKNIDVLIFVCHSSRGDTIINMEWPYFEID